MKIRAGIELANLSDAGCVRDGNEDYYCYYEPEDDADFLRGGRLALVADGMGGARAGEIASRLASDTIRGIYFASGAGKPLDRLVEAFSAAHRTLADTARQNEDWQGMGTTCTAIAIQEGNGYFAHVGDSRLYLIRDRSILCLTRDQTVVNDLIEQGLITPEQASVHPHQHVLTAALGASPEVHADVSQAPIPLAPGDVLLLCTDGLWNLVEDRELLDVVDRCGSQLALAEACDRLVETARERGGPDNITVLLLRYMGPDASAGSGFQ